MDDKRAETSSDSDFGDSWTIIDKNSFCSKMVDVLNHFEADKVYEQFAEMSNIRDCALSFQDDSNNDADADSDGISVISEPEEPNMNSPSICTGSCNESNTPPGSPKSKSQQNRQLHNPSEARTPKKNKIKFNKPLTPPNTATDCDAPAFDKTEKKHKKRSYIHNRNDKVSNFLNILVAGTIATAAGLALGHLMGSKSDCANLSAGINNDLTYKQLQYENYKLKNELQDLKRESWHFNRVHKTNNKTKRYSVDNEFHIKTSNSSAKNAESKFEKVVDFNNNLEFPEILNHDTFYGPKTYAESVNSNFSDKDYVEIDLLNSADKHEIKSSSKIELPESEVFIFPGIISSQEIRNNTNSDLLESTNTSNATDLTTTQINHEEHDILVSNKEKNSKTNQVVASEDLNKIQNNKSSEKLNLKLNKEENGKTKRKNKEQSHFKKGRSVSAGKESGDFENSVLSIDNKQGEKFLKSDDTISNNLETTSNKHEQQVDKKNSQKNPKHDHKYKEKQQEKKEFNEHHKSNKLKNNKNSKYSDEKFAKVNKESKDNNSYKKSYNKEKKSSKISFEDDKTLSQTDIKPSKIRKYNDKTFKTESKNDRRKSDFKQEKKDKYEDWEMKKGYEYYTSSNKVFPEEQSDDDQMNKVKRFPSGKTVSSCDEPVYSKASGKKDHEKKKNLTKADSLTDNWAFDSLCDNDTNNVDGSWLTDLAKHREEQRKKKQQSEWLFERAKTRDDKRNGAKWFFDYMDEREQCRAQDKHKQNKSKRSQKKSTNFKNKL